MSSQTAARRYATALADVIVERGEERIVQSELDAWEKMISSNEALLEAFSNPTVAYEQKQAVLERLIARTKVRPTTANFLRLLLKNQRLAELSQMNEKLSQVLDERTGIVSADVTSARPVSEETKTLLGEKLAQLFRRPLELVVGGGSVAPPNRYDPILIIVIATNEIDETGRLTIDALEVGFQFRIEKNPARGEVFELDRLHRARYWAGYHSQVHTQTTM